METWSQVYNPLCALGLSALVAMWTITHFFEGYFFFGKTYPGIVSFIVLIIIVLRISHALRRGIAPPRPHPTGTIGTAARSAREACRSIRRGSNDGVNLVFQWPAVGVG